MDLRSKPSVERYPYQLVGAKPLEWSEAGVRLGLWVEGQKDMQSFWVARYVIKMEPVYRSPTLFHITEAGLRKLQDKHGVRVKVELNSRRMGMGLVG